MREWLAAQAAGGYVAYDAATGRYTLPAEQAFALAVEDGPAYLPGAFQIISAVFKDQPRIAEAFRHDAGGLAGGPTHYFLLLAPAILLVPLWLDRHGRPQAGVVMAAIPPVLSVLHYVLLPYGGRVGLLGFGTTAWLMAAMVLIARTDWALSRTAEGKPAPADTIGMA